MSKKPLVENVPTVVSDDEDREVRLLENVHLIFSPFPLSTHQSNVLFICHSHDRYLL